MEQFQPNILQFLQERFRPQVSGFPTQPCFPFAFPQLHSYMQLPVPAHTSVCSSTISPTSVPVKSPLPIGAPFRFSQADVDVALYGYTNSKDSMTSRHAVSGIRSGDLSYGIDRILSTDKKDTKKPSSPPMEQQAINMTKQELSSAIDPQCDVTNHVTHDFAKHVTRDVEFPPALGLSCTRGINYEGLDMPNGLTIRKTLFGNMVHYGVFCKKAVISKGTRFGPFKGRVINTSEIKSSDDNSLMWEIFRDGKLSHFIDGRRNAGNWMAFVNCARYAQEQNLIALQSEGDVFYEVCKDIPKDTELLVWYGDSYLQFMGVPVALKELTGNEAREEADASEGYQCERCGKVFAYRYYRDKHLKYTRCVDQGDRKFPCHLCTRSFEKRDRLRIHILHVHEKHRPHKCLVCNKSFSQSSSLNKHMRVHSGERPYKCVYCNKAFTASSILRTHIRQHSGEKPFKCRHCGKAFASHAAHDSHVRRTHARDKTCACSVCGQTFTQGYELKVHMSSHARQQS